ncbi:hypothetical protein NE237_000122 [Protea cynaroides]|uniref:Uncharacterized protein n=1 Tax=Protea cynaroides TaxID=273540 RepID=A0A9Q0JS74_9MAGN|nr:hypothetical protein NE237_000122 [Protea cynaroides]
MALLATETTETRNFFVFDKRSDQKGLSATMGIKGRLLSHSSVQVSKGHAQDIEDPNGAFFTVPAKNKNDEILFYRGPYLPPPPPGPIVSDGVPNVKTFNDTVKTMMRKMGVIHGAKLRGSKECVVIKVLKPGIEDILVPDLNCVYVVARILEFLNPELSRASLITLEHDLKQLATATKSIAAIYMACGIDITKASVFVQSHGRVDVATKFCHTNCSVNRMIQFKEKSCKAMSKSAFLISPESIFLTQKILEFNNLDKPESTNFLSIFQLISGRTKERIQTKILEVILDFHAKVTTTVRIKRKGKRECKEEDSQGYNRVNKLGKLTRVEADASSGKTSRHFKDYVGKAPFKLHTVEDLFKSSLIESGFGVSSSADASVAAERVAGIGGQGNQPNPPLWNNNPMYQPPPPRLEAGDQRPNLGLGAQPVRPNNAVLNRDQVNDLIQQQLVPHMRRPVPDGQRGIRYGSSRSFALRVPAGLDTC